MLGLFGGYRDVCWDYLGGRSVTVNNGSYDLGCGVQG